MFFSEIMQKSTSWKTVSASHAFDSLTAWQWLLHYKSKSLAQKQVDVGDYWMSVLLVEHSIVIFDNQVAAPGTVTSAPTAYSAGGCHCNLGHVFAMLGHEFCLSGAQGCIGVQSRQSRCLGLGIAACRLPESDWRGALVPVQLAKRFSRLLLCGGCQLCTSCRLACHAAVGACRHIMF